MKIRYYISGHGLGHASRSCHILSTLKSIAPDLEVEVSSPAQRWFLDNMLQKTPLVSTRSWDIGVIQHDSLQLDLPATIAATKALYRQHDQLLEAEAADLKSAGVSLVVCDIPPLPLAAAERAGIPSVAIGNFDWEWIYRGLAADQPEHASELLELAEQCADDYRRATLMLRLPMASPCASFSNREDVPLVARQARCSKSQTRKQLGIAAGKKIALLSFGGFGIQQLELAPLALLDDWVFLCEQELDLTLPNLYRLRSGEYFYPDLVAASDVVITKPGYGIVSEAIANHCAVLYTPRGNFPEEPLLLTALKRYTRCRKISNEQLRRGDWQQPLAELLATPAHEATLATNGAEVVAARLAELAGVAV
ncbi:MAG: hypothetical protein C0624_03220 [Desulfuromonas sp.]|nr:MAG: hypothetical protein C0624_03220 [Desulfuromonas sp.]